MEPEDSMMKCFLMDCFRLPSENVSRTHRTQPSWWMTRKRHGPLVINRKFIKRTPILEERNPSFAILYFSPGVFKTTRKAVFAICLLLHLYKFSKKWWQGQAIPFKPYLYHFLKQRKFISGTRQINHLGHSCSSRYRCFPRML